MYMLLCVACDKIHLYLYLFHAFNVYLFCIYSCLWGLGLNLVFVCSLCKFLIIQYIS